MPQINGEYQKTLTQQHTKEHRMERDDLLEILYSVNPSNLNYQEWVNVGMALKESGYTAADWDKWSQQDSKRYHAGECFQKWDTFVGSQRPVKAGTIVQLAKEYGGWNPYIDGGHALEWDDTISATYEEKPIIDTNWLEKKDVLEPKNWNPVEQLVTYLETLFQSTENVGYVVESWENNGKYVPTKGSWSRTSGELIQALQKCNNDIGAVLGDYNPEVGAWIRFNPLDGKGVKNENVSDYRYALVESDTMEIEEQYAILQELELPIACLVHSGKKSLHAIIKVEAANYEEYRKRVDYLYSVCQKNGLKLDSQNRNPSRLSRMPGVMRNGKKQFLIATNIGKENWITWQEWVESISDDLPEPESMADTWNNLPELSPPLIDGVLRQGHKMLLAGPSKAGKSFSLIELCCALAEGKEWLGWQCAQGKVLYLNLELDRASCLHRFRDVYETLGWAPNSLQNIDIWNLRGKSLPMDKLAPKLIRRALKKNYIAVIIDPIYKVITGDENSADQMALFCNQFDRVCTELGAAVIYCHHHSKGSQGNKRSMDRASGSGVFARDPDALLDLIELDLPESVIVQNKGRMACDAMANWLDKNKPSWKEEVSQDDAIVEKNMLIACEEFLTEKEYQELIQVCEQAKQAAESSTAWRIDATLREFAKFQPKNLWFTYPIHKLDDTGALKDIEPDGDKPAWEKASEKRKKNAQSKKADKNREFEQAVQACNFGEPPTKKQLAEYLGVSERSILDRVTSHGGYIIDKNNENKVIKKDV